jgi:hypothetical protein
MGHNEDIWGGDYVFAREMYLRIKYGQVITFISYKILHLKRSHLTSDAVALQLYTIL